MSALRVPPPLKMRISVPEMSGVPLKKRWVDLGIDGLSMRCHNSSSTFFSFFLKNYGGHLMHQQINRWIDFFQGLIFTQFRQDQPEAIEVLTWLIVGHLFGLFNPNQFADALGIDKSSLYTHLATWSLDQWKRFLVQVGCHQAVFANSTNRVDECFDAVETKHYLFSR